MYRMRGTVAIVSVCYASDGSALTGVDGGVQCSFRCGYGIVMPSRSKSSLIASSISQPTVQ